MADTKTVEIISEWTPLEVTGANWLIQNKGPYVAEIGYGIYDPDHPENSVYPTGAGIVLAPGEGMISSIHGPAVPVWARALSSKLVDNGYGEKGTKTKLIVADLTQ